MPQNADDSRSDGLFEAITPWVLLALSLGAAVGGVIRVLADEGTVLERLDDTTLLYFAVAGALLLLRQVKSLAFGDLKVEFERVKAIAEEAQSAAQVAEDAVLYGSLPQQGVERAGAEREEDIAPGPVPDDPWKGVFGGRAEDNGRRLRASVREAGTEGWYTIRLVVESVSARRPLESAVRFYLHDTFRNSRPVVPVGPNGRAELRLLAWGAFTVGAVVDDGATRLELDLADLESAPQTFRER